MAKKQKNLKFHQLLHHVIQQHVLYQVIQPLIYVNFRVIFSSNMVEIFTIFEEHECLHVFVS